MLSFFQVFFSSLLIIIMTRIILSGIKFEKRDLLVLLIIVVENHFIYSIYPQYESFNVIITILIFIIYLAIAGNGVLKSVLTVLFVFVVLVLIDSLSMHFLALIFNLRDLSAGYIRKNKVIYPILLLTLYFFGISFSVFTHMFLKKVFGKDKDLLGKNIIIVSLFVIILLFVVFYWIAFSHVYINAYYALVLSTLMFTTFVASLYLIYSLYSERIKTLKLRNRELEINQLKQYTTQIEHMYRDVRKFRHDYINILGTMTGYFQEKRYDDLKCYFDDYIIPLREKVDSDLMRFSDLANIEQLEIKGIVTSKLLQARELGIDVFVDICEPISLNIDIIDAVRLIGILLDNAIEAAIDSSETKLRFGLIKKEHMDIIIVSNTFREKIPIYNFNKEGFTTKGIDRGLGLDNLREIVNNYYNMTNDMLYENEFFTQRIEITDESALG